MHIFARTFFFKSPSKDLIKGLGLDLRLIVRIGSEMSKPLEANSFYEINNRFEMNGNNLIEPILINSFVINVDVSAVNQSHEAC
ncbi:hypothetical protein BpHYR1_042641 [Brachionus plicatilis]|uniref:Uncharacterized protein n=1 Tax=Brachionus plicatilis TaxID=10195 RepID=A0A3M7T829_BRAPC|nr:hypothetical protein BpHYR1_042641 [Brachionus plicatilis]